jgi:hypothetical protein
MLATDVLSCVREPQPARAVSSAIATAVPTAGRPELHRIVLPSHAAACLPFSIASLSMAPSGGPDSPLAGLKAGDQLCQRRPLPAASRQPTQLTSPL